MKMKKKIIGFAVVFSMVAGLFFPLAVSDVKAAAFTAVAMYDFENGTGMSPAYGQAPTVVSDSERGNVLQFADGERSKMLTNDYDESIERHSYRILPNSPSSLKFANPFKGRNLENSGATIAMWVKVPTERATGVTEDGEVDETLAVASGLVGFVDSKERSLAHPDCVYGGHSEYVYYGRTFFGITAQPCVYFNQIHHNSLTNLDTAATMSMTPEGEDCVGKWRYLAVSITNETVTTYLDGQKVYFQEVNYGKRHLSSDEYVNPGNDGMPYLLDFLTDDMTYRFAGKKGTITLIDAMSKKEVTYGKIPSNVSGYVGYTGFSGTQAGVCMDDLAFFTKAFNDTEMASLFEAAKTPGGIAVDGGNDGSGGSGSGVGESEDGTQWVEINGNTYTLYPDGRLVIKGTSEVDADWKNELKRQDEVSSVYIEEGVTGIGNVAFSNCSNLTNISIPRSVTRIGDYAFNLCTSLTSIKIPGGVTSIGYFAFCGCSSLTSVVIPEEVTNITWGTFEYCYYLSIYAPAGSYAEIYAKKLNIAFVPTESQDSMVGDVNGDGSLTATDALAILKHIAGVQYITDAGLLRVADVNGDSSIAANDALDILKKIAGLITSFKAELG